LPSPSFLRPPIWVWFFATAYFLHDLMTIFLRPSLEESFPR